MKKLSDRLITKINSQVEHVVRNGDVNGYAGCVNLSFAYVEGESLLMALKVRNGNLSLPVMILILVIPGCCIIIGQCLHVGLP